MSADRSQKMFWKISVRVALVWCDPYSIILVQISTVNLVSVRVALVGYDPYSFCAENWVRVALVGCDSHSTFVVENGESEVGFSKPRPVLFGTTLPNLRTSPLNLSTTLFWSNLINLNYEIKKV